MLYYYLTSSNLLILSKPKKSNKMKKGYASLDGTAPEPSKNRLLYGILALLIGLAVGFFLFSGNSSQPKHTDKLPNVIPNIAPEPKPEKPDPKAEKTIPKPEEKDLDPPLKLPDTKIVTSFKIVKTYKREGRQFYT